LAAAIFFVLILAAGCGTFNKEVTKAILKGGKATGFQTHYSGDRQYVLNDAKLKQTVFEGIIHIADVNITYQHGLHDQAQCIAQRTADVLAEVQEQTGVEISFKTCLYLIRLDEIPQSFKVAISSPRNEFRIPLFIEAGKESCEDIVCRNISYPWSVIHELIEFSLIFPHGKGRILPDLDWNGFLLQATLANGTRWFREGFAEYAAYVAEETAPGKIQCPDEWPLTIQLRLHLQYQTNLDKFTQTDERTAIRLRLQSYRQPFSSLSKVGTRLFAWRQDANPQLDTDYYNAALGLFLLIRERYGESAIRDIMHKISERDFLNGADLIRIVNDTLKTDIKKLVQDFRMPQLGVTIVPLTPAGILNEDIGVGKGLLIKDVTPGSPACAAGLIKGDVLTTLAGKPTSNILDLDFALLGVAAQKDIQAEIWRKGHGTMSVVLATAGESRQTKGKSIP
jgi:hypothetical protein